MTRAAPRRTAAAGFTLLEMLVVVAIMSVVALVALEKVDHGSNQLHFDETVTRLKSLRRAVVGTPERSLNGEAEVRGFATDMGRLPEDIRELVEPLAFDGGTLTAWNADDASGVAAGWRGPYLTAVGEASSGLRAFRDGWGNPSASETDYAHGWKLFLAEKDGSAAQTGNLIVQSFGADGLADPASQTTYDAQDVYQHDYPPSASITDHTAAPTPLVAASEYMVAVSTVTVNLRNRTGADYPAAPADICARLYYPADGAVASIASAKVPLDPIAAGDTVPVLFTFAGAPKITWGVRALRIVQFGTDCADANATFAKSGGYRRLMFLPPAMLSPIDWILKNEA